MTTRIFLTAAVLFTLSVSAYGQSEYDSIAHPRTQRLEFYERQFKPSLYDTEIYLFKKNDSTKSYGRSIDQMTSAPPETLQGFRIQLLATNNFDDANITRNLLTATFPDLWIYLVFEAPTYKIRVGDFVNRAEAKPLLDVFQAQGYRKAWIVPDRIISNQPPKPPVPVSFDSTSVYR